MEWIHTFLQSIAVLMISPVVPSLEDAVWKGASEWVKEENRLVYTAESTSAPELCRANRDFSIITPILAQGGHQFFVDGRLVLSSADRTFSKAANFYNTGILPCSEVIHAKTVRWEAYTQTHSLAKLKEFPQVRSVDFWGVFLRKTANIMISGTLIGLGILCFLIFYGKVERPLLTTFLSICLCYSVTFVLFVPDAFLIQAPQQILQPLSDICLFLGIQFTGRLCKRLGYTSYRLYQSLTVINLIGFSVILLGSNLDQEQVGSNICFVGVYAFLITTLFSRRLYGQSTKHKGRNEIFKAVALFAFVITAVNDALLFQGIINSLPLVPFGVFCCTALLALAVNDRVVEAYEERDYLRSNLEAEVANKTEDLLKKSTELESTLSTLKVAQADLVQSAKLAALGTLSAGIAHEINNALNYVNGSIDPIHNILKKDQITPADRSKAERLLGLMKEGLNLTFGIIVNLKRHTSISPDQFETLQLREVIEGTLLLLKNKLSGIEVEVVAEPGLQLEMPRVSMSQIVINLVTNAIDALEEASFKSEAKPKKIRISAKAVGDSLSLVVEDSGLGIPPTVRERIFDPFFTTKAVGKGTGLGLHIVLSEVKKQGGQVAIQSGELGGASFALNFPIRVERRAA